MNILWRGVRKTVGPGTGLAVSRSLHRFSSGVSTRPWSWPCALGRPGVATTFATTNAVQLRTSLGGVFAKRLEQGPERRLGGVSTGIRGQSPHALTLTVRSAETARTQRFATIGAIELQTPRGGGAGNRTRVKGFAGPCLNHSATPPGEGSAYPAPYRDRWAGPVDHVIHW